MRPRPSKLDRKHPEAARDAMEDIKDFAGDPRPVRNEIKYVSANRRSRARRIGSHRPPLRSRRKSGQSSGGRRHRGPRRSRSGLIYTARVRLFTLIAIIASLGFTGCGGAEAPLTSPPPTAFSQVDLTTGSGATARRGARLTVHYTGWLYDSSRPDAKGKQFDSSVGGEPFTFRLGNGDVIGGWDRGFDEMRVGRQATAHHPARSRVWRIRHAGRHYSCQRGARVRDGTAGRSVKYGGSRGVFPDGTAEHPSRPHFSVTVPSRNRRRDRRARGRAGVDGAG